MNCIEACRLEDRKSGRPSAKSLWLQHDNTVKELKNQLSGILLSALVQDQIYSEAGQHMLPVGHTHEDIGFLSLFFSTSFVCFMTFLSIESQIRCFWSVHPRRGLQLHLRISFGIRRATADSARSAKACLFFPKIIVIRSSQMQFALTLSPTPDRLLETRVAPVFHNRGETFKVILLDKVRPWKELAPKIVSLDNAYRPRKDEEDMIPHSFVFQRRDGILVQVSAF